ncbi:MAG: kelch repeat-containing protein [Planctomycetota bacterium]
MLPRPLFGAFVALALASSASAQALRVVVTSSTAAGACIARVTGEPGRPWALYLSEAETPTAITPTITLDIDPARQLASGLFPHGLLGPSGEAVVTIPTSAGLVGRGWTLQACSGRPSVELSPPWRATFLAPETFGPTARGAVNVSAFGDLFPLADGRMLALGGAGPVATTWEPDRQEFAPNGLLPLNLTFAARAQLADGRVLCAGGLDVTTQQPSAEAYLYDPATGTATSVGPMTSARAGAAACRLPNGKVFLFGGLSTIDVTDPTTLFNGILNSSELYDPVANTFTAGPTIAERKAFATATLMNNNQVLVAGGLGVAPVVNLPFVSNLAWTYSATTNTFGFLPKTFTEGRMFHSATKLSDGRVLLSGGITADLTNVLTTGDLTQIAFTTIGSTAVYSTSGLGSFSVGPALLESRAFHTATALDAGATLVAGGASGTLDIGAILAGTLSLPAALATSELVTPGQASLPGAPMLAPRAGASALRSPIDGRVVIVGGGPGLVELYQP